MDRSSLVQTSTINVPSVATSTTVLAPNNQRATFMIQNQDTSPLKICFGTTASSTVYHLVLKAASGAGVGDGGTIAMEGPVVYTGIITCYSAGTPSYTVLEM